MLLITQIIHKKFCTSNTNSEQISASLFFDTRAHFKNKASSCFFGKIILHLQLNALTKEYIFFLYFFYISVSEKQNFRTTKEHFKVTIDLNQLLWDTVITEVHVISFAMLALCCFQRQHTDTKYCTKCEIGAFSLVFPYNGIQVSYEH